MSNLLTKCGACGNEVSVNASACPKCGNPNHQPAKAVVSQLPIKKIPIGGTGIYIVVTILGLALIGRLAPRHSENEVPRASSSYEAEEPQAEQQNYRAAPSQAYQRSAPDRQAYRQSEREPASQSDRQDPGGLEGKFGPKPEQSQALRAVGEYARQVAPRNPLRVKSCMQVRSDEKAGWIVGCTLQGNGSDGPNTKYASWFVIQNGRVVKDLPRDAYSID